MPPSQEGGKIDAFIDCASPYSYFAFTYLRRQRKVLEGYGVEIEFRPFFLGAVMQATGNKPPSALPARGRYGSYDLRRACEHYATPNLTAPSWFPLMSILPQRVMTVVKARYPGDKFDDVYDSLWIAVWRDHVNVATAEKLTPVLAGHFHRREIEEIYAAAATKEVKDQLAAETKVALDKGAYGAPWFWLTNYETGVQEPVFGSDRWSYMFRVLGVEVRELEIVDKGGEAKL